MTTRFDDWGWFTTDPQFDARVATVPPADTPGEPVEGQPYPNWTGYEWKMLNYVAPPAPTPPPPVAAPSELRRLTKRAFQDRFPLTANGVSRKYDLMDLFMRDDGYAAALGVSGAALYELRALIVTGLNRLNASAYVDLDLADAANFTGLLLQPSIPEAFRLTLTEREAMLNTPLAAGERYTG